MNRKLAARIAALMAMGLTFAEASHAALATAVTTAVNTAQTDTLELYTTLTGAGVLIWVGRIIYNHFKVR